MRLRVQEVAKGQVEVWVGANLVTTVGSRARAMAVAKEQAAHRKVPLELDAIIGDQVWSFRVHPDGNVEELEQEDASEPAEVGDTGSQLDVERGETLSHAEVLELSESEELVDVPVPLVGPPVTPTRGVSQVRVSARPTSRAELVRFEKKSARPGSRKTLMVLLGATAVVLIGGFFALRAVSTLPEPPVVEVQSGAMSSGTVEIVAGVVPQVAVSQSEGEVTFRVVVAPEFLDAGLWSLVYAEEPVALSVEGSALTGSAPSRLGPHGWVLEGPGLVAASGEWGGY